MKKPSIAMLIALAIMLIGTPSFAQVQFFVDATLPASDTATFTVSRVDVTTPLTFTTQAPGFNDLSFGVLELDPVNGIFLTPPPGFYWVIDVGSNGAGMPDITANYVDSGSPATATSGLGDHATFNYAQIVTNPDLSQTTNDIATVALGDVTGLLIDETDYAGGFLRLSLGLATGDPVIPNATPFTGLDAPGEYSGTLTLTAVFD